MPDHTSEESIFGGRDPAGCEEWGDRIAEAADRSLSAADEAAFAQHVRQCKACAEAVEQTRKGLEWLRLLASEPEPPADLVGRILAGSIHGSASPAGSALPGPASLAPDAVREWPAALWGGSRSLGGPAASSASHSRLKMTAAMAFFSIALTLNVMGIQLSRLSLSNLRPASLGEELTRQYYAVKEIGVKYYDSLPFVRKMEANTRGFTAPVELQPQALAGIQPQSSIPTPEKLRRVSNAGVNGPAAALEVNAPYQADRSLYDL